MRWPKPISYYAQFGLAMFAATLIIGVIDTSGVLTGALSAAILVWLDRRKARRANSAK